MQLLKVSVAVWVIAQLFIQSAIGQSVNSSVAEDAYENHNQIDYGPLRITSISGSVEGPARVVAERAKVLLFTDQDHRLVGKSETDDNGHFSLPTIKNGKYRLVVKLDGFCTANVPIILRKGSGKRRILVHLLPRAIDTCSYGELK